MQIPRLNWPYEGMGILAQAQAEKFVWITQYFGENPQNYLQYGYPGHDGLDLAGKQTKIITPVWYGKVKEKTYASTAYGHHYIIDHEGFLGYYAHGNDLFVKEGDKVTPETSLMDEDSTGNSTGTHLHLGIRVPELMGQPYKGFVDPLIYLTSESSQPPVVETAEGGFTTLPAVGVVTAAPHLNIRLLPHAKSLDIGDLFPNQEVEVLEIVGGGDGLDWAKIRVNAYAWVKYLVPKSTSGGSK